jgi:hypothetical protein
MKCHCLCTLSEVYDHVCKTILYNKKDLITENLNALPLFSCYNLNVFAMKPVIPKAM